MADIKKTKIGGVDPRAVMSGGPLSNTNPWRNELWKAILNGDVVYLKDKTLANCWIKYGCARYMEAGDYAHNGRTTILADNTNNPDSSEMFSLPMISDIQEHLHNPRSMVLIHKETKDKSVIKALREYYATTGITEPMNNYQFGTIWQSARDLGEENKNWAIKVNRGGYHGSIAMYFFSKTNVEEVTIDFVQGNIRSWDGFFLQCKNLRRLKILYNGSEAIPSEGVRDVKPGVPADVAGDGYMGCQPVSVNRLYRECTITSENSGLEHFNWRHCREFFSAFNGATELRFIPASLGAQDFEEVPWNTMVPNSGPWNINRGDEAHWSPTKSFGPDNATYGSAHEMFSWTPNLEKIGPVIDCKYLVAGWPTSNMFYSPKLREVRLKNLSNGVWKFDNPNGGECYLPALDKASVDYLFQNLVDLKNGYEEGKSYATFIVRDNGELWCPEEWRGHITREMVQSASDKGWRVFINKVEFQLN